MWDGWQSFSQEESSLWKRNQHGTMGKIMVKTTGKGAFIRMSNPGNFGSKTLNVILLLGQHILGNEERERAVLDSHLFDMRVEPLLDLLPNAVRSGLAVKKSAPSKTALSKTALQRQENFLP